MSAEQVQAEGERLVAVWKKPAPLFVYGSLLFPEVMDVLIERDPERTPASVNGWRVVAIPGKLYPGLVPSAESDASGHLLTDLTETDWRTLDAFESDFYELRRVKTDQGAPTWVYVLRRAEAPLEGWNSDAFVRDSLGTYLSSCTRWRQRFDADPGCS